MQAHERNELGWLRPMSQTRPRHPWAEAEACAGMLDEDDEEEVQDEEPELADDEDEY